jgi:hypothetical protein
MTFYSVSKPYELFFDSNGEPLENGYIYIGEVNQNPITNQLTVYWDKDGIYPAAQPIRTLDGYPSRNGSPGRLFVDSGDSDSYSILVQNKKSELVYNSLDAVADGFSVRSNVDTIADLRAVTYFETPLYLRGHTTIGDGGQGIFEWFDGAAPGTYVDDNGITIVPTGGDGSGAWIRQYQGIVYSKFFGAVGDGITDDTTALQGTFNFIGNNAGSLGGTLIIEPGTYLINDTGIGCGTTAETEILIDAYGVTIQMEATTNQYNIFTFRSNMTIKGITLKGYIDSGTGWADVVPSFSFGFRASSNGVKNVEFIDCIVDGVPYDGWYISHETANVKLTNCIGKNCYRNDFAAVYAEYIEIEKGEFGENTPAITKVTGIDFEPNAGQYIRNVYVHGTRMYHALDFWAANGAFQSAKVYGVIYDGTDAVSSWYRVGLIDFQENTFLNGASIFRPGTPEIVSGQTYLPKGKFEISKGLKGYGPNLIINPYNSFAGYTNSSGGTTSFEPNYPIGSYKGIRVSNTGGGYNQFYQTLTVVAEEYYSFGGTMIPVNTPSGGNSGFVLTFNTLGFATVWLIPEDFIVGKAYDVCIAVKMPVGVTQVRYGFGGSGGTQDNAFTNVFTVKGIIDNKNIDIPKISYFAAAPTIGTWVVSDRTVNSTPAVGQPKAWVCTVAGTPGTWVSEGNL